MKEPAHPILSFLISAANKIFAFLQKKREIVITLDKLEAIIADRFPISKRYLKIFGIACENPQVALLEGEDRIQIGLDALLGIYLTKQPKEYRGGFTVTFGMRYDNETQEFYLSGAELTRLEIPGLPKNLLGKLSEITSLVSKEFIESKPIYKLEGKDIKTTAVKMLFKGFEIRDQAIRINIGL